jgi:hypothetical protein
MIVSAGIGSAGPPSSRSKCSAPVGHVAIFGYPIRVGRVHVYPGTSLRLENLRQAAHAVGGVDAQPRFPQNGDLVVLIDALHS